MHVAGNPLCVGSGVSLHVESKADAAASRTTCCRGLHPPALEIESQRSLKAKLQQTHAASCGSFMQLSLPKLWAREAAELQAQALDAPWRPREKYASRWLLVSSCCSPGDALHA